jgi:hypothetical protein
MGTEDSMTAHMDGLPLADAAGAEGPGVAVQALAEHWENAAATKQPVGTCKRNCAGVLLPVDEELVDGVLWLTARCTHCGHEVYLPDGRRARPPRHTGPSRAFRPVTPPPDWRKRALPDE